MASPARPGAGLRRAGRVAEERSGGGVSPTREGPTPERGRPGERSEPRWHWDPDVYLRFADERGRPFVDLLARVGASSPRTVVDLGCGAGNLTALLAGR